MKDLRIFLYTDNRTPKLRLEDVALYLEDKCRAFISEVRDEFFTHWLGPHHPAFRDQMIESLSQRLARARIRNQVGRNPLSEPLAGEVEFERLKLVDQGVAAFGYLYDAPKFLDICGELIETEERGPEFAHIVFTNQLLASWDEADGKYHARTIVCGGVGVVSTTGLVEAPAKSPEYYLLTQQSAASGISGLAELAITPQIAAEALFYEDDRITDVVKGYVLQAVMYQLTGQPFCDDPGCRLFNARSQKQMLHAQLDEAYDLCPKHEAFFHAFQRAGVES